MVSAEMLRQFSCFSAVGDESLEAIAAIADEETVRGGSRLFDEGDPADTLSVIVEGEVKIEYLLGNGELRSVDTLRAGDILGWSALVAPYKMTGSAIALGEIRLVRVKARPLRELCEGDPLLGYRLMSRAVTLLAGRLEGTCARLVAAE